MAYGLWLMADAPEGNFEERPAQPARVKKAMPCATNTFLSLSRLVSSRLVSPSSRPLGVGPARPQGAFDDETSLAARLELISDLMPRPTTHERDRRGR